MPANVYLKRFDITNSNGWVKLSDVPMIVDAWMQSLSVGQISLRFRGGTGVLLGTAAFLLQGVDLAEFEISTSSGTPAGFLVIGYSREVA